MQSEPDMPIDLAQGLPYLLLWSALGATMFPRARSGWKFLAGISVVTAFLAGIVEWQGLAIIAVFAGACLGATRSTFPTPVRALSWSILVTFAVALAAHRVPGINNLVVFEEVAVSRSAQLYTLYWSYDKALVGVLLYAICVQPQQRTAWRGTIAVTATLAVLTPISVVVPALLTGFVAWDPKLPTILVMWIPANLLITCLAEEAFFRGLLQGNLSRILQGRIPSASLVAILVAAISFGAVHIGGGLSYALLATLAGIGYGTAYHLTQRVEASILVHFFLNLVHLTLFTYPFLAPN